MKIRLLVAAASMFLGVPAPAPAQGKKADYERADSLRDLTQGKVFRARVDPHWSAGADRFWYRNDLPAGAMEFISVQAAQGTRKPAFDHDALAAALTMETGQSIDARRLPFDRIVVNDDGSVVFEAHRQFWQFEPASGKLTKTEKPKPEAESAQATDRRSPDRSRRRQDSPRTDDSPDGRWTVFVREHNLYVKEKKTGSETQLSFEGSPADTYEPRVFWSPDSRKLVALRTQKGDEHLVYLIESSPKDQLQPKLQSYSYLKPGDRLPITKPHLFSMDSLKEIPCSDGLFPNPWSIDEYRWSPDSKRFTFLYNQRGHQVLRLVSVDAETGAARPLIEEQSSTFVDYAHKHFAHYLDKTNEILWMTERDGWNHLYLFDACSGELKHQVTQGKWVVRAVDRVDEEKRQVWFHAGGMHPDHDPYYMDYARVDFDGKNLDVLTSADGTHDIRFSPDRRFYLDTYSRVDLPPVTELRRSSDGSLACELECADWSALLEVGWRTPERFVAKGRDGTTDIFGVIYRPMQLEPGKRYPVIEAIYAGPQGAFVPKSFAPFHRPQALAELGFIVVQVDGMGTNWRSKAFHDVCCKNLADAGFPDRILWMKAAAARYPEMDLSRVGVYGGSAGGQNALGALLFHGEFYKAGVADCGCHDNRMDKIWWNELWMGWPVGPHYAEQSNVTNAHKLQGKLLLMVGELDRNVDPASTMQVVNALIKANKDFELIVFPGAGHGAGGGPYGERRRRDFFVRHLLGIEPRRS